MKKVIMSFLALVMMAGMLHAQTNLVNKWTVAADANAQTSFIISTAADNTRGFCFNPATNHLLVVSRNTTPLAIWVLNAADGSVLGTMNADTTVIFGGNFTSKIGAGTDGVLYLSNLAVANGNYRIYKYANESAAPVLLVSDTSANQRYGDAFRVIGSGANTRIYVSGSGSSTVRVYDGNGTLVNTATNVVNQFVRQAIAPEASGSGANFWGTGSGTNMIRCDSTGATLGSITASVVPVGSACAIYASFDSKKYIITNDMSVASTSVLGLVADVTNGPENATIAYQTPTSLKSASYTPAVANGTFEVDYDPATRTIFYLTERNGITAWTVPAPVEDWKSLVE